MPIFFVRLPELLEQLAVGKTTLYARIKQGTFPPPVKFGERVSAWPEHEVDTVVSAYMRSAHDCSTFRLHRYEISELLQIN